MISEASSDDAPRAAALLNACFDDRVITVAGIRYRHESARPEDRRVSWRAERDGELVGWAFGGLDAFAPVRTVGFAGLVVHPAHRRRGIGSALWAVLSDHLETAGARRIVIHGDADAGSTAFGRKCGFDLAATHTTSAIDPRTIAQPPSPPAGIALVPLSDFVDAPERVFEADRQSVLDEPGPSDLSGMTYEVWRQFSWDYPDCDHELGVAAVADGVVVGATFLNTDRKSGKAANVGTGVVPAFRGRGLGLLMKQHSLAAAARVGITRAITQNDETNAPMLAINARLGYRPLSSGHAWVLER